MNDIIQVLLYNSAWPAQFESEACLIKQALGNNCLIIHHIGSTAVPHLPAKPIIDMIPVVEYIELVDKATDDMLALGYLAKGESGMLFRRFFQKEGFNIHIYEQNTPDIERYLKFRDWMGSHPEDRDAYAKLKQQLASEYPDDITRYCLGKEAFVASIDHKTGFDGIRIVKALTPREWESVSHFRQYYFFDKASIADPYTWRFNHEKHDHLVLYKGTLIIGYAHLQYWPEARAALRIIVVDESHRNHGIGSQFLQQIERWLKQQGIEKLQVQSSPEAYQFYCKNNYIKMPFNDPDNHESCALDIDMGKIL